MGQGAPGGRGPPGVRDALAKAFSRAAVDPKAPAPAVPPDFHLWQLGVYMGVPAWVFEGYPIDQPPVEWVIRSLEFFRLSTSRKGSR